MFDRIKKLLKRQPKIHWNMVYVDEKGYITHIYDDKLDAFVPLKSRFAPEPLGE